MNSKIAIITLITAALGATGLIAKTTPGVHRTSRLDRMSATLNLTAQQKTQAKSIFTAERTEAKPIRDQLRGERQTVQAAITNHKSDAEIRALAKNEAPALGDLAAMRASAFAKFYGELTPAQQQKLASIHQEREQAWQQRGASHTNASVSR